MNDETTESTQAQDRLQEILLQYVEAAEAGTRGPGRVCGGAPRICP